MSIEASFERIEHSLERIADSLESMASGGTSVAVPEKPAASKPSAKASTKASGKRTPAKASPKKDSKGEGETEHNVSDVRKALTTLQKAKDSADSRAILQEVGKATVLSKLDPGLFGAVIAAATAALEE